MSSEFDIQTLAALSSGHDTTITLQSLPDELLISILEIVWELVRFGHQHRRYAPNKVSRRWNKIYARIMWADNFFTWRKGLAQQLEIFAKVAIQSTRIDDQGNCLLPLYAQPIQHRYGEYLKHLHITVSDNDNGESPFLILTQLQPQFARACKNLKTLEFRRNLNPISYPFSELPLVPDECISPFAEYCKGITVVKSINVRFSNAMWDTIARNLKQLEVINVYDTIGTECHISAQALRTIVATNAMTLRQLNIWPITKHQDSVVIDHLRFTAGFPRLTNFAFGLDLFLDSVTPEFPQGFLRIIAAKCPQLAQLTTSISFPSIYSRLSAVIPHLLEFKQLESIEIRHINSSCSDNLMDQTKVMVEIMAACRSLKTLKWSQLNMMRSLHNNSAECKMIREKLIEGQKVILGSWYHSKEGSYKLNGFFQ